MIELQIYNQIDLLSNKPKNKRKNCLFLKLKVIISHIYSLHAILVPVVDNTPKIFSTLLKKNACLISSFSK